MSDRKERDIELWKTWKANPNPHTLRPLLKAVEPIITVHVNKMTGNLPRSAIRGEMIKQTVKAFDGFDPDMGVQLSTYLYNTAGRKLNRYVYEHSNIGTMPEPRVIMIGTYNKVRTNLEEQLGRKPTIEEIADEMKVPVRQIELLQKESRKDLIHDFSFGSVLDDERTDIDENINMLLAELHGNEKEVLAYTYGLDGHEVLAPGQIATKLGIPASSVTQIKTRLAERLKKSGVLHGY